MLVKITEYDINRALQVMETEGFFEKVKNMKSKYRKILFAGLGVIVLIFIVLLKFY